MPKMTVRLQITHGAYKFDMVCKLAEDVSDPKFIEPATLELLREAKWHYNKYFKEEMLCDEHLPLASRPSTS